MMRSDELENSKTYKKKKYIDFSTREDSETQVERVKTNKLMTNLKPYSSEKCHTITSSFNEDLLNDHCKRQEQKKRTIRNVNTAFDCRDSRGKKPTEDKNMLVDDSGLVVLHNCNRTMTVDADYDINNLIEILDEFEGKQLESASLDGVRNKMLESGICYGEEDDKRFKSGNFDGVKHKMPKSGAHNEVEDKKLKSRNSNGVENTTLEAGIFYGVENKILKSENFDGLVDKTPNYDEASQTTYFTYPRPLKSEPRKKKMRNTNKSGSIPHLAGYNPLREDFEIEFNNNAEELICMAGDLDNYKNNSDKDELDLIEELQVAMGEMYNFELQERQKRKNVIKKLGLMDPAANKQWSSKMKDAVGKAKGKKLMKFLQIMDESQINHLCTSLEHINSQRAKLNKLNFYRTQQGITLNSDIKIYEDLKVRRRHNVPRVKIRDLVSNTVPTTAANYCATSTVTSKQPAKEISHLPRFKDLTTKEAEFCSSTGLVPELYLDKKDLLTSHCKKANGILLKIARKLAKIDVNKTRKMYDFLMEQGYIWNPGAGGRFLDEPI